MKYLVLGSSGQVGLALANYIENSSDEVIHFDLVNDGSQDLRIADNPWLFKKMEESDFVFFLAFDVGGSRYLKEYQNTFDFVSNNIRLMENTFSLLNKTKKPFIFASSQMSNMAYSPYGQLKGIGELYSKILGGLIVKFWNVYGLERDLEKSHVITDFLLKAKNSGVIDMMTNGKEERQFLFADDCSECLIKLSKEYEKISRDKDLHITSFKWSSVSEIAQIVSDLYPGSIVCPSSSSDEVQKNKRNEPDSYILNFWQPKTSLEKGIKSVNDMMFRCK